MRIVLVVAVAGLIVSGCSDPKKPSKANFAHAIDRYLAKHPLCMSAPTRSLKPEGADGERSAYPAYVARPTSPAGEPLFAMEAKPLEALVRAGLLVSRDTSINVKALWSRTPKPIAVKAYDLTEAGRKAFDKGEGNPFGQQFCYGTAEVIAVTRYTEPNSAMGATISEVAYDYRVKDRADWSRDPAVLAAFPAMKSMSGETLHARATVVLMNDGWSDSRDAKM